MGDVQLPVSHADLESLVAALDVKFVALSECLVANGHRLEMGGIDKPGIHYSLVGKGKMSVRGGPPFDLTPHTLVVVPPNSPFWIEVPAPRVKRVPGRPETKDGSEIRRFIAGDDPPEVILICGFFNATYGVSTDLFAALTEPIVEAFAPADRIQSKLEAALEELVAQELGAGVMSSALLKQVLVQLIRRSLEKSSVWARRFTILRDPQISRAFAVMAAKPGADHTVTSLAKAASLGRSAFMAKFVEVVGQTPMAVLRDLRMRQADQYLRTTNLGVEQVADAVGYASRASFVRAFRRAYGREPSEDRG